MFTNSSKNIQYYKKVENTKRIREILSRLSSCFHRLYRTTDTKKTCRYKRRKIFYSGKKKVHTAKNQITVNNCDYILHKVGYKNVRNHTYDVYKNNHPIIPKEVVNVFDLAYLGIEMDFPEQLSALPYKKKRNQELSQRRKRV